MFEREAALCGQFEANINEDTSHITLTAEELEGLPTTFIADLPAAEEGGGGGGGGGGASEKGAGLKLGLKAPLQRPVMQMAASSDTRKRVMAAVSSRCADSNGPILEEIAALRHARAQVRNPTFRQLVTIQLFF